MTRKQIEVELDKIDAKIAEGRRDMSALCKGEHRLIQTKNMLEARLCELGEDPPARPEVSLHAMLRYFQRVKGFDLEALEQELIPPRYWALATCGKSIPIRREDGSYSHTVKMSEGVITTVIRNEVAG